jgi:hypothetical protein
MNQQDVVTKTGNILCINGKNIYTATDAEAQFTAWASLVHCIITGILLQPCGLDSSEAEEVGLG